MTSRDNKEAQYRRKEKKGMGKKIKEKLQGAEPGKPEDDVSTVIGICVEGGVWHIYAQKLRHRKRKEGDNKGKATPYVIKEVWKLWQEEAHMVWSHKAK